MKGSENPQVGFCRLDPLSLSRGLRTLLGYSGAVSTRHTAETVWSLSPAHSHTENHARRGGRPIQHYSPSSQNRQPYSQNLHLNSLLTVRLPEYAVEPPSCHRNPPLPNREPLFPQFSTTPHTASARFFSDHLKKSRFSIHFCEDSRKI